MAASNIRSRQVPGQASSSSSSSSEMTSKHLPSKVHQQHSTPSSQSRLSVLDILRILGGLFLLSSTLSYFVTSNSIFWNYRPPFAKLAELKAWIVRFSLISHFLFSSATYHASAGFGFLGLFDATLHSVDLYCSHRPSSRSITARIPTCPYTWR